MVFHGSRIEHYSKNVDGSYKSVPTILSDVVSLSVGLQLGEAADSFSFNLVNIDDYQFKLLSIDDRVKIYGIVDSVETLLLDGIIQSKNNNSSLGSKIVSVTGLNLLEKMFNALVTTTGESVPKPASFWIKNIIDQVNEFNNLGNTSRKILYTDSTIRTTTEKVSYRKGFEKAFKLIEELSNNDYTQDGQYYYYLDENNYFYWQPLRTVVSKTLSVGEEIVSHRTEKGMYDIVNYIILNCGKSPYGATILQFGYDDESIAKFGWKVKLVTRESIGNEMLNKDRRSKPNLWDDDSNFPNTYPYIPDWKDSLTGTINSNGDYNTEFVEAAQRQGLIDINGLLEKTTGCTYKVRTKVQPSFDYVLGELCTLTIPDNWWNTPQIIRLKSINYAFGSAGWSTDLKFEEDSTIITG